MPSQPCLHALKIVLVGLAVAVFATAAAADIDHAGGDLSFAGGRIRLGYREVNQSGNEGRVAEYTALDSGPIFGGEFNRFKDQRHFYLLFDYTDDDDYFVNANFDHYGLLRVNLSGSGMVHNLEHLPYGAEFRPDAIEPGLATVDVEDHNPGDRYSYRIDQQEVRFRGKYPGIPAHLNLQYWRFARQGERQLRYLDENCTTCHLQSRTQDVDRVTDEVTVSLDSHLGPLDLIVEQVIRQFEAKERVPSHPFGEHQLRLASDALEHDETPDSRMMSTSVKLHTSLSGGVVAAGSHTWGRRENRSDLTDIVASDVDNRFQKTAGDFSYTPSPRWTLNFRYRLLDLDQDNGDSIVVPGLTTYTPTGAIPVPRGEIDVRPAIDLTRAFYQGTIIYRPVKAWTFKGDYRREEIHRSQTGGAEESDALVDPIVVDLVWELPEDEIINTYRLSVSSRYGRKSQLRLQGWYELSDSTDPAYGSQSDRSHSAFLGLVLKPSPNWGGNVNLRYRSGVNNRHHLDFIDEIGPQSFDLDHSSTLKSLSAGAWGHPVEPLHLGLHYSLSRSEINQDVLFGHDSNGTWDIEDDNLDYRQQVQALTATGTWRFSDRMTLLGEFGYTLSKARYSPGFAGQNILFADNVLRPVDATGLRELSEIDIRQWRMSLGLNWSIAESWLCSARFAIDDYEDRHDDYFDGRVETCSLSLAKNW